MRTLPADISVLTMNDDSFEVVGRFLSRIDAELARTALEAEDITATVGADDAAGMRLYSWLSGVRVLVRAVDAVRRAILHAAEPEREYPQGWYSPNHDAVSHPKCSRRAA